MYLVYKMPLLDYQKTLFILLIIINIHKLCYGLPGRGIVFPSDDDETTYSQRPPNSQSNNIGFQRTQAKQQPESPKQSQQQLQRNMTPNMMSNSQSLIAYESSDTKMHQRAPNSSSPSMLPSSKSKNTTTTSDDDDDDDDDGEVYDIKYGTRTLRNCRCKIGDRCAKTDKC